ncbi:MAG: hypothetical protein R3A79_16625 [Nannocystaceae bacterium]
MRAFFLVNEVAELIPSMTTARMIVAAARAGVESWVAELGGLSVDAGDRPTIRARPAPTSLDALAELRGAPPRALALEATDTLLVRLNPARFGAPQQLEFTLWMLGLLARRGVAVVNSAAALERTATKAFLSELPAALRPAQAVAAAVDDALAAIERLGPEVVIKPARGTRGIGVIGVDARTTNPRPLVELLLDRGAVVIQELLPDAAAGDTRIVLVDGEPLVVDGELVAVRRVPAVGELRSNLHAGGRPEVATLSADVRALLRDLGPHLRAADLRVAGVDVLAGKILEINVWAPGGLGPFERTTGIDAAPALVEAILRGRT